MKAKKKVSKSTGKRTQEEKLVTRKHAFELNRETRRMVCVDCNSIMNECSPQCPGLSLEKRSVLARQFASGLAELANA